jgi:hypothetical protein
MSVIVRISDADTRVPKALLVERHSGGDIHETTQRTGLQLFQSFTRPPLALLEERILRARPRGMRMP